MRKFKSLQTKFVRTLLLVTMLISAATLAVVVFLSAQTSARHLASVPRSSAEPAARTRRISGIARGSESPPPRELARG